MPIIKLYAGLRSIAGTKELSITPPSSFSGLPAGRLHSASRGASLGIVLTELEKRIPALEGVIRDNGQIRPHVVITINGHNATDLAAAVTEEDIIAIFPPIAGG